MTKLLASIDCQRRLHLDDWVMCPLPGYCR